MFLIAIGLGLFLWFFWCLVMFFGQIGDLKKWKKRPDHEKKVTQSLYEVIHGQQWV